jgi:hypothetical protein
MSVTSKRTTRVELTAAKNTAIDGSDVFDDNVSRASIVLAITARSDKLAIVLDVEVRNLNSAAAVELDNLVGSVESTASADNRGT